MKSFTMKSALAVSALLLAVGLPAVNATTMVSEGCFSDSTPLTDQGSYTYQSNGYCQNLCLETNSLVFALFNGLNCLCGNELPAKSTKTSDSDCNVKCAGWPDVMCGGTSAYSVYLTGVESSVPYYSSGSSDSNSTSTTDNGSTSTDGGQVETSGGQTVYVTKPAETSANSEQAKGGSNTAAIAAGVVVGVVGFCALVGAGFFLWRFKSRQAMGQQYTHNPVGGAEHFGKPMSQSSDSRFDGDFMAQRRQSNGSIDDDQDFSRRILQVTNPDRR